MHIDEPVVVPETIAAPPGPFAEAAIASAEVDANRIELLFESDEYLRTPMNDADVIVKAAELAAVHAEIETLDSQLTAATSEFKAEKERITDARDEKIAHGNHLARMILDREHETLVKVREEKVFATGMVRTVRVDTGAIVRERALEADERQADLFAATPGDEPRTCPACGDASCEKPCTNDGNGWHHTDEAPASFSDLHESDAPDSATSVVDPEAVLGPEEKTNGKRKGRK